MRKEERAWEWAEKESSSALHVDGERFLSLDSSLETRNQNWNLHRSEDQVRKLVYKKKTEETE